MNIPELFAPTFSARRANVGLEVADDAGGVRPYTFGELDLRARCLAALLLRRGLVPGDRLAVFLPNRLEIIDIWLACTRVGIIVVPINVLYKVREIGHILADADPYAVVTSGRLVGELPDTAPFWDVDEMMAEALGVTAPPGGPRLGADTPAALVYTSGTTGASKGAVLTHGNFVANAKALVDAWRITAADRYLAALPLFHVHGLGNGLHSWLASGCHMRLVERFEHEKAADLFDEYKPTLFFGVPTMYVRLLELEEARARAIGARARLFVCGSAPLPAHVLEAFKTRFGHAILERYGMTETLMNSSNPYDGERRAGTVGAPLAHVEIQMRGEDGSVVPAGETGELWVRGTNVCAGYWRRPDASAAAFIDGWFRTGDVGRRSADGYITLAGRKSDLIITGGFNVYPREVEELLLEAPGVKEAAVVGVADPLRGEIPVAYLVTDGAIDEPALRARLGSVIASFKVPKGFVRVDQLPRTALGKVQKHLLPDWQSSRTK